MSMRIEAGRLRQQVLVNLLASALWRRLSVRIAIVIGIAGLLLAFATGGWPGAGDTGTGAHSAPAWLAVGLVAGCLLAQLSRAARRRCDTVAKVQATTMQAQGRGDPAARAQALFRAMADATAPVSDLPPQDPERVDVLEEARVRAAGGFLVAEELRVQAQTCEQEAAALLRADMALLRACDVLARRAALSRSHVSVARAAAARASDALRCALTHVSRDDHGCDGIVLHAVERARAELEETLARIGEAVATAGDVAGSSVRVLRSGQQVGDGCRRLAPALRQAAECGYRLSLDAVAVERDAGLVLAMQETSRSLRGFPAAWQATRAASITHDDGALAAAVAGSTSGTVSGATTASTGGTVVWFDFDAGRNRDR